MADHFDLVKVNHVNAITDGHVDTIEHFRDRLGFQLNMEIPDGGDGVEACLMTLGRVMFEFFSPRQRGDKGQARLLDLYDDHYVGVEYQVPDVSVARELCAERGVRIINDVGPFFFTHGGACLGITFELWDGDWHAPQPDNPRFTEVAPLEQW